MRIVTLVALLVLLAGCATAPPKTQASEAGLALDSLLSRYAAEGFSGTVLVAKNDRIVLHKGYGFADRAKRIPNDTETLFENGSITKTFIAVALLKLEAAGKLRTSDLLSTHLGPFPPPKDTATIEHLTTHTGGLLADGADTGDGLDRDRFIENVKRLPAEAVPGEHYRYSNAGYSVLAAIIEKTSGVPFATYVRDEITEPLGLHNIYWRGALPAAAQRHLALGYMSADDTPTVPTPLAWGTFAGGGMNMTVGDMYRWHLALQGGKVLAPGAQQKMFLERPNEGYAWSSGRDASGRRLIRKGGGMPQYAAQILYYPDDRLVIIWASNSLQKRWRQDLNRGITDVMFGAASAP